MMAFKDGCDEKKDLKKKIIIIITNIAFAKIFNTNVKGSKKSKVLHYSTASGDFCRF